MQEHQRCGVHVACPMLIVNGFCGLECNDCLALTSTLGMDLFNKDAVGFLAQTDALRRSRRPLERELA